MTGTKAKNGKSGVGKPSSAAGLTLASDGGGTKNLLWLGVLLGALTLGAAAFAVVRARR